MCTSEDVFNCITKHLIGLIKEHFSPKNVMPEFILRVFLRYRGFKVSSTVSNSDVPTQKFAVFSTKKYLSL